MVNIEVIKELNEYEKNIQNELKNIDEIVLKNSIKVLNAFNKENISEFLKFFQLFSKKLLTNAFFCIILYIVVKYKYKFYFRRFIYV